MEDPKDYPAKNTRKGNKGKEISSASKSSVPVVSTPKNKVPKEDSRKTPKCDNATTPADAIIYQAQVIRELTDKVGHLEKDWLRPDLIIHGIVEEKGEKCQSVVSHFFKNTMEIDAEIKIKTAHRIGKSKNRPMKVILKNSTDKAKIFANAGNLQEKKNIYKKSFKVEDQLPAKFAEKNKKNRNIVWRNKRSVATKIALSVKKGQLIAAGKSYVSPIIVPKATDFIKLKEDEILAILDQDIKRGVSVTEQSSTFTGYICDANNFEDVNRAYEYVRYVNMKSRHIICACKIPGENVLETEEFEDDNEHGAGQILLDYIYKAKLRNCAIFVVRDYDGQHIGPIRFERMIEAAKSAVNQKPFNRLSQKFQFSWEKTGILDKERTNNEEDQEVTLKKHLEQSGPTWGDIMDKTNPLRELRDLSPIELQSRSQREPDQFGNTPKSAATKQGSCPGTSDPSPPLPPPLLPRRTWNAPNIIQRTTSE